MKPWMIQWSQLALGLVVYLLSPGLSANSVLQLQEELSVIEVGDQYKYYYGGVPERPEGILDIPESRWQAGTTGTIPDVARNENNALIYRVKLLSTIPQKVYFKFYSSIPHMVQSRLYLATGSTVTPITIIDHFKPTAFVELPAGSSALYLLLHDSTSSAGKMTSQASLFSVKHFYLRSILDTYGSGLIYGIAVAMLLYNLAMYLFFKRDYFLFYCGYVISITAGLMFASGHSVFRYFEILQFGFVFSNIFAFLFITSVLNCRELYPNWYRAYLLIVCLFTIAMIYSYLANTYLSSIPFLGLSAFSAFFLSARSAFSGYKPAYFFVFGWAAVATGIMIGGLNMLYFNTYILSWAAWIGYAFEVILFSFASSYKARLQEKQLIDQNQHAFSEMKKMVYAHQVTQIQNGVALEKTMPTHPATACILSFDIVESSKIRHIKVKDFLRNVFAHCNAAMSEGYDGENLKARAYRIKEMGDGFLCSIGYPFASLSNNPAHDALDLAETFAAILAREAQILHSSEPVTCGIGIAIGPIAGFYPEFGTKEYDLFGRGLVLATRYENMRKILFADEKNQSILIIHELVYNSLDPTHRQGFTSIKLAEMGIVVRDDPTATQLYYKRLPSQASTHEAQDANLKAV